MPKEVIEELRNEIRTALRGSGGEFTNPALQSMKKLDSFIKETMRVYPFANRKWLSTSCPEERERETCLPKDSLADSFERKVLRTFSLSNGQVIPAGVILECSTAHNQDDEVFPEASRFDPWRFSKLQEQEQGQDDEKAEGGVSSRHQMVSVSPTHLPFGYGRHACPGRFFAINEIKMILSVFLLNYDFKTTDGSNKRYDQVVSGSSVCTSI